MSFNSSIEEFERTLLKTIETINTHHIKHGIEINTNEKVAVFGDIHGDIDTLIKAYEMAANKNAKYFIFCGDYIDKGKDSLSCFNFVLDNFNKDPEHFIPLMGNHETLMFGDLLLEIHKSKPELLTLLTDVICSMPISASIKTNNKSVFCSHGAFPHLWRPKLIQIHDEYDDVWKILNPNMKIPDDINEMIYEDNVKFNISPIEYINKIYDDYVRLAPLIHESPYNIHQYSATVDKLDKLRKANNEQERKRMIDELKDENNKRWTEGFVMIVNDYKTQMARIERARQNMILLKDYIQEGDAYISENEPDKSIDSYEKFLEFVKKSGTQFFKHERYEVHRYDLIYPIEELKTWMSKNKINAFIRGHQLTLNCATSVDLKTNKENMNPVNIPFIEESELYLTIHTTSSYKKLADCYKVGKFAIIDENNIEIVAVE